MTRYRAARGSGNYSRAKSAPEWTDTQIITCDILLGVLGALLIIGVPFVLAALKQLGAW